jgi:hypothetical protein
MLSEWRIDVGTMRPNPMEMTDFNVLTLNARVFPGTAPLVAKYGERVRIRFGNLSAMEHHPILLHGFHWKVVATDGGQIPEPAQWPETTVLVAVGQTRTVEFIADNPGDWAMHCHMNRELSPRYCWIKVFRPFLARGSSILSDSAPICRTGGALTFFSAFRCESIKRRNDDEKLQAPKIRVFVVYRLFGTNHHR